MKTVIFLHGWGGSEDTFAKIKPFFNGYYRCLFINFDCEPQSELRLEDYTQYVETVIQREKIEKCYIAAHSFGARVAVLLAARNPGLLEKMVLTGAAGLRPRFNLAKWLRIKWYKITGIGKGSHDYRKLSDTGKATFKNIVNRNLEDEISNIAVPTLLIWGKRDKTTPVYMGKLWTRLQKSARMTIYSRSGHFCFIDNSERFVKDTWEFFR